MKTPERIPIAALLVLADEDPDPLVMNRLAGHLLAHAAARSLVRQAAGESVLILGQLKTNVAADPEAVRRATGRGDLGDD